MIHFTTACSASINFLCASFRADHFWWNFQVGGAEVWESAQNEGAFYTIKFRCISRRRQFSSLIVWVRVHPFFLMCKKNIKWYHHLFFSSRELLMALPTFYRFRCLRKEPHDERLVVVMNCAVWMVLWDFTVFINMRIIWSNQISCNSTPFTTDLKFFAPLQLPCHIWQSSRHGENRPP